MLLASFHKRYSANHIIDRLVFDVAKRVIAEVLRDFEVRYGYKGCLVLEKTSMMSRQFHDTNNERIQDSLWSYLNRAVEGLHELSQMKGMPRSLHKNFLLYIDYRFDDTT